MMKFYRYYGYSYGERVAGMIIAPNKVEAEKLLKKTCSDYNLWSDKTIETVHFNENNVCEIYYG